MVRYLVKSTIYNLARRFRAPALLNCPVYLDSPQLSETDHIHLSQKGDHIQKNTQCRTQITVPPKSNHTLKVLRFTTKQTVMYGLDIVIGSDNPGGSIGKATRDQSNWDKWFRWEDIAPDHVKQTVKYMVETTNVVTKVEVDPDTSKSGQLGAAAKPLLARITNQTRQ